jgi:hypothetical protein
MAGIFKAQSCKLITDSYLYNIGDVCWTITLYS